jgi:hypothetical protein
VKEGQRVELIVRKLDDRTEIVTGARVNGEEIVVPLGSKIRVECEAGENIQTVTIEMFADTVRYVEEGS